MTTWNYGEEIGVKASQRDVEVIFLHCSASDNPAHDDVSVIDTWHRQRGFNEVGYHYFINKNGDVQEGRSLERSPAAQRGHNAGSIAICLHGLDVKKFTDKQFTSLVELCDTIEREYGEKMRFRGHCEVSPKRCPVFDYRAVLNLGADGYRFDEPPLSDGPAFVRALRITDRGNAVKQLQAKLNANGASLDVDGLFGQLTRQAVMDYQERNGLIVDGIYGPETHRSLYSGS